MDILLFCAAVVSRVLFWVSNILIITFVSHCLFLLLLLPFWYFRCRFGSRLPFRYIFYEIFTRNPIHACFVLIKNFDSDGAFGVNLSPSPWHEQHNSAQHIVHSTYVNGGAPYICHMSDHNEALLQCVAIPKMLSIKCGLLFDSLKLFLLRDGSNGNHIELHQTHFGFFSYDPRKFVDTHRKILFLHFQWPFPASWHFFLFRSNHFTWL